MIAGAVKKGWLDAPELQASRERLVELLANVATDRIEPSRARLTAAKLLIFVEDRTTRELCRLYRRQTSRDKRRLRRLERRLRRVERRLARRLGYRPDCCKNIL
jgi:hypothetical protein